jgi:transposase
LVSHRRRLIRQRTQARNRLQSLLHRHNLNPPEGELFAPAQREWWQQLKLQPMEQLLVNVRLLDWARPDLARLTEYAEFASRMLGAPIPPGMPVVGRDAFRTSTGVHASAIAKAGGAIDYEACFAHAA